MTVEPMKREKKHVQEWEGTKLELWQHRWLL